MRIGLLFSLVLLFAGMGAQSVGQTYSIAGAGGGAANVGSFTAAFGSAVFTGSYVGAEPTVSESSNGNYSLVIPAETVVLWLNMKGTDADLDGGTGNVVITIDNSANSTVRRYRLAVINAQNNTALDKHANGFTEVQAVSSNTTTITVPSLSNLGPTGFILTIQ